jgi:D-alanyl-lipoteichoic acid acyltransferase DltB (MBOAT superfamily)
MQFVSPAFVVFLPLAFVAYWVAGRIRGGAKAQNLVLIAASYAFYAYWDLRLLWLLAAISVIGFVSGLLLERESKPATRKAALVVTLLLSLGILGFFKYFGFFLDSLTSLLQGIGFSAPSYALNILLPLGLSFYTFQMLTYPLDVYRRQMHATRDAVAFCAFASFFAQLTAGPIGRAKELLPRYETRRVFEDARARDGLRQVLWGLTKKVLVADNLAPLVDQAYGSYQSMSSLNLFVAAVFFAIQLYADFSGYSDMAIGVGKLFGLPLPMNFDYPYFSRSTAEFWRRWHMSFSFWIRDYVYIPLGGSRVPTARRVFNVLVSFLCVGIWHGANWTFVVWGLLNGIYQIPGILLGRKTPRDTVAHGRLLPRPREAAAVLGTFLLAVLAWVFFRADSLAQAAGLLRRFFTSPGGGLDTAYVPYLVLCAALLGVEWLQREQPYTLRQVRRLPVPVRWASYCALLLALLVLGAHGAPPFVYVQF